MLRLFAAVASIVVCIETAILPAYAQDRSIAEIRSDLQVAVCQSDWEQALHLTDVLINSSNVSQSYRESLTAFRQVLEGYQARSAYFIKGCEALAVNPVQTSVPL